MVSPDLLRGSCLAVGLRPQMNRQADGRYAPLFLPPHKGVLGRYAAVYQECVLWLKNWPRVRLFLILRWIPPNPVTASVRLL